MCSNASLTTSPTPACPPNPPILSFSKLFWGDVWLSVTLLDMCLKTVSLSRLSSLCLLPPSLSNQKAKPCRQLRANNKSLPCGCLKMTERPERQQRKCWFFPVSKPTLHFFFLIFQIFFFILVFVVMHRGRCVVFNPRLGIDFTPNSYPPVDQ